MAWIVWLEMKDGGRFRSRRFPLFLEAPDLVCSCDTTPTCLQPATPYLNGLEL